MMKDYQKCFYCNVTAMRVEYDHFPIPKCAGGTEVVPCCVVCHDLKDRINILDYTEYPKALNGLFEKADRHEKIVLARIMKMVAGFESSELSKEIRDGTYVYDDLFWKIYEKRK